MGEVSTGPDQVHVLLTGASTAGAYQADHDASLGAYAGERFSAVQWKRFNPLTGVRVEYVAGRNGIGNGSMLASTTDSLRWRAPGSSTMGEAVTIANGETVTLFDGDDTDAYVIVTRTESADLGGVETVQVMDALNNVVGGSTFEPALAGDAVTRLRAVMFSNTGTSAVSALTCWIDSDETVVAPAGTLQVALETPSSGALTDKTGDGEESVPAGLSWSTPVAEGAALSLGSLAAGDQVGLWIRRYKAADAVAAPLRRVVVHYKAVIGGTDYYGQLRGAFRVGSDNTPEYVLFVDDDLDDIDTSGSPLLASNSPSFSLDSGDFATLADEGTHYVVVCAQNYYGVRSLPGTPYALEIDGDGDEVDSRPDGPENVVVTSAGDGLWTVVAQYVPDYSGYGTSAERTSRADRWAVYSTSDGDDPDPSTDTPVTQDMLQYGGPERISYTSESALLDGTTVKVLVRTQRNAGTDESPVWVESDNTDVSSVAVDYYGPHRPRGTVDDGTLATQQGPVSFGPVTTYVDESNNLYWLQVPGETQLWADTVLVWRLIYGATDSSRNGLHTHWTRRYSAVSGAGGSDAVEVASWDATHVLYVTVNGERRLKIDLDELTLSLVQFRPAATVTGTRSDEPVWLHVERTSFQVWDTRAENHVTAAELDSDGVFALRGIPWRTHANQAGVLAV